MIFNIEGGFALPPCPDDQNQIYHNCFGTFHFFNGDKYVGEFRDGKFNGQGTYFNLANNKWKGDKYIGGYKDDMKHGHGNYISASGDEYVGDYKDGRMHGNGTYYFRKNGIAHGDKYVGEFRDGNQNGWGTYTYADGRKYIGEYLNGNMHGEGTLVWTDGTNLVGTFEFGRILNGEGTFVYSSGERVVGKFQNGQLNGYAIEFNSDGSVKKEGIFKDDKFLYSTAKTEGTNLKRSKRLNDSKSVCTELGFKSGTEDFGKCVLKMMDVD